MQYNLLTQLKMKYKHIAIGGTFDLLHKGHEKFIRYAFSLGEKVTIGITSNKLVRKLKGSAYQSFDQRVEAVHEFVASKKLLSRANIVLLNDFFGPALNDETIDTLLVTKDSLKGAHIINEARAKLGLRDLYIETFPLIMGFDKKVISSNRIKTGTISHEGLNYYDYLINRGNLYLPQNLRGVLRKPLGGVYQNLKKIKSEELRERLIISVGDYTTSSFLKNNIIPCFSIVDLKIQRKICYSKIEDLGFSGKEKIINVINPPGIISRELVEGIYELLTTNLNDRKIILVDGEEDLAVLPVALMAPLGFVIYYGLRNKGLVKFTVSPSIKDYVIKLLQYF